MLINGRPVAWTGPAGTRVKFKVFPYGSAPPEKWLDPNYDDSNWSSENVKDNSCDLLDVMFSNKTATINKVMANGIYGTTKFAPTWW